MNYTKAQLIVLNPETYQEEYFLEVMFNPTEFGISQSVIYSNPKLGQPVATSYKLEEFTVTLFFDTYNNEKPLEEKEDVRFEYTEKIAGLMRPTQNGKKTRHQPMCIFSWGSFNLKGKIQKVDQKFTMFLPNGIPVRATVTITILPVATNKEVSELIGRKACRKLWTVKSGERLDLIAHKALKDPALWREIADANQITDPLAFPTEADLGKVIIIPDLANG
ncbi:MAG TPA: peptidoglycan-binding protein LysM [Bacillota bacterium]|nr:peptidoglycan-binding protein LysM [Bacillota bacterium]